MPDSTEARLAALVQRVSDLADDVAELREIRKEDHHRLRSVEGAVKGMVDAQRSAREGEARQYQKLGARIAIVGLLLTACIVAISCVSLYLATR